MSWERLLEILEEGKGKDVMKEKVSLLTDEGVFYLDLVRSLNTGALVFIYATETE